MRSPPPVLFQFHYSPYCEKVRWALDHKAIPWVRETLMPGPHVVRMIAMTGQRYLPVMQAGNERIVDSTRIIAWLEAKHPQRPLYPADPALQRRALDIEDFCDEELGKPIKRVGYRHLLEHPTYLANLLSVGQGIMARRAYRVGFAAVSRAMRASMGLSDRRMDKAGDLMQRALDRLDSEIGPSGFLAGDQFTVADLTAASVISPLLPPPYSPYLLQGNDTIPEGFKAWRESLMDHPAVQWAARIYDQHRGTNFAENALIRGSGVI